MCRFGVGVEGGEDRYRGPERQKYVIRGREGGRRGGRHVNDNNKKNILISSELYHVASNGARVPRSATESQDRTFKTEYV